MHYSQNYLTNFFTNPTNEKDRKKIKLTITTLAPDGKLGNKKKASKKLVIDIKADVMTTTLNFLNTLIEVKAGKMIKLDINNVPIILIPSTMIIAVKIEITIL